MHGVSRYLRPESIAIVGTSREEGTLGYSAMANGRGFDGLDSRRGTAPARGANADSGPAFPNDSVKQRPLYAREAAWTAFEDVLELEVERTLRGNDVVDLIVLLHDGRNRIGDGNCRGTFVSQAGYEEVTFRSYIPSLSLPLSH